MAAIVINNIITRYSIDQTGRVYSHISNRYLNPAIDRDGYCIVSIAYLPGKIKKCKVHRLVAEYFIANPNNFICVNHLNNIRSDNRVENLEWITALGNVKYRTEQNRTARQVGTKNGNVILTESQVLEIRNLHPSKTYIELSKKYGVSRSQIMRIVKQQRWKHLK